MFLQYNLNGINLVALL